MTPFEKVMLQEIAVLRGQMDTVLALVGTNIDPEELRKTLSESLEKNLKRIFDDFEKYQQDEA